MAVFCLDVETMGVESTSVLLSIGIVYYDGVSPLTYQGLLDNSIFVKFDAVEQQKLFKRTVDKDTLEWWKKQSRLAQETNLLPHKNDIGTIEGLEILDKWFTSKKDYKDAHVWVRGSLDQAVFESLCRAAGIKQFVMYNSYRDVRTFIDCFYPNSKNGYVDVDLKKCADYSRDKVLKHHPSHDSALDLCMMLAGITE